MDIKIKIKIRIITVLLCLIIISSLMFIGSNQFARLLMIGFMGVEFFILYFFYKGRNWARIIFLILSVLSLVSFLGSVSTVNTWFEAVIVLFNAVVAIYLLFFLNTEKAKAYFKSTNIHPISKKSKLFKGIVIIASICVIFFLAIWFLIFYIKGNVEQMGLHLEDINTGGVERLTNDGIVFSPCFSHNGKKIAYIYDFNKEKKKNIKSIKVFSLKNKVLEEFTLEQNYVENLRWSEDDSAIFYISHNDNFVDLWKLSLADGTTKKIKGWLIDSNLVLISPDIKWILYKDKEGRLYVKSVNEETVIQLTEPQNFLYDPKAIAWSQDSKAVIFISFVTLEIINIEGKILRQISVEGLSDIHQIFSAAQNKDILMFKATGPKLTINLYMLSVNESQLSILRSASFWEFDYNISPDGKKLIYIKPVQSE